MFRSLMVLGMTLILCACAARQVDSQRRPQVSVHGDRPSL